jgi:Trk K+ transport system NAD-binding subunit
VTIVTIITTTILYHLGMNHLEQRPTTILEALEWVTQTMTTVGYGQDAGWNHQIMYVLVIFTQLAGITIVFMSIPTVVTPWMEQRLTIRPDSSYSGEGNHVIITEYTPIVASLINELEERNTPYVLIESNEETATELYREGYQVMLGDPVNHDTLLDASIEDARLAILDCPDERNASIALTVQEFNCDIPIIAVAEKQERAAHLSAAGIDEIIYPREKIGEVLARKALSGLGKKDLLEEKFESELEIREFPVLGSSPLVNQQLKDSNIREQIGIRIIGVWREGEFKHNPPANFRIHRNDILVASGSPESLNQLHDLTEIRDLSPDQKNVLIIGYGKEGHRAEEILTKHGVEPVLLNDLDLDGVDIVGDGSDPERLKNANIESMATVIIAVSDDATAILITLMVKDLNPRAEILVQINNESSLQPIYRAGASYVLSLEQLTSQMLAGTALEEDLLYEELNLRVRRCGPGKLVDETPSSVQIGKKHRITVAGVERDGKIETEIGPDYKFQENDKLYLAGDPKRVKEFTQAFELEDARG